MKRAFCLVDWVYIFDDLALKPIWIELDFIRKGQTEKLIIHEIWSLHRGPLQSVPFTPSIHENPLKEKSHDTTINNADYYSRCRLTLSESGKSFFCLAMNIIQLGSFLFV